MNKSRTKTTKNADGYPKFSTVAEYEALSEGDKEKVDRYYTREIPLSETRPLNARERAKLQRVRRRSAGRPKIGEGAKVVAVTLEKGFLTRVDDFAKKRGLKRSELIVQGLQSVMGMQS